MTEMTDFFFKAATQILMVLIYIGIGFILRRSNMLPATTAKTLSVMETLVFLPALLFNNLSTNVKIDNFVNHSTTILFGAIFLVFVLLIAFLFAKIFSKGRPKDEHNTFIYIFAFANYGYFGYPLIEYVFGSEMLASMILFAVPFTFAIYTYGAYLPKGDDGSKKKITFPKNMTCILCALVLGVVVGLLNIKMPTVISQTTSALKACMSPVSMIMTGFVLGSLKFKQIFSSARAYVVAAVRLVVIPLIFGAALLALGAKGELMIIPLFIASMPIGLNVVVFTEANGRDSTDNARMCFISYILSFITVPLIMAFLSQFQ